MSLRRHRNYVDPAEYERWETERQEGIRAADLERYELDRRVSIAKIPCLIDRIEEQENAAYVALELAAAAIQLLGEVRERWAFAEQLLADVLRERRDPARSTT